jgi:hypothetical protein
MSTPPIVPEPPKTEKTPRDVAYGLFQQAKETLDKFVAISIGGGENKNVISSQAGFVSASVDLLFTGLDEWLAESAKARTSAEADRQADRDAAKEDKRKQDSDRATMNKFTKAIMVAAIVSATATGLSAVAMFVGIVRTPAPIVMSAPIVYTATPDLRWSSCSAPSVTK